MQKRSRVYIEKVKRAKKLGRKLGKLHCNPYADFSMEIGMRKKIWALDEGHKNGKFEKLAEKIAGKFVNKHYTSGNPGPDLRTEYC